MDASIAKLKSTTFCGRRFSRKQLSEIQQTVRSFPSLSRHEFAQTICENLQWQTPKGSNRFNACLHLLESLKQQGVLQLPEKISSQQRGAQKPIVWTPLSAPQASIECELEQLMPLALQAVSEKQKSANGTSWWTGIITSVIVVRLARACDILSSMGRGVAWWL